MSFVLNNVTTGDNYTSAQTLTFTEVARVNLDVANAAIYYQLQAADGDGSPASNDGRWRDEVFCGPTFRSLSRAATGVRIRSAVIGAPAQVTVECIPASELGAEGGTA